MSRAFLLYTVLAPSKAGMERSQAVAHSRAPIASVIGKKRRASYRSPSGFLPDRPHRQKENQCYLGR